MIQKVIGVEGVNYVSHKNNQPVVGVRLHLAIELSPSVGQGFMVKTEFISNASVADFHCGEILTVLYEPTQYGARCTGVLYKDDVKK